MWKIRWCSIILFVTVFGNHAHCESTLDDKYFLGENWLSYSQAVQACQSRSMKLLSIENQQKNEEISELMRQKDIRRDCWISGRTLPDRRSWVWLDGKPFRYQNWNPTRRHPRDHVLTDNCITVARHHGRLYWDDQFCQNLRCFICEYPTSECNEHRIKIRFETNDTAARTARRKEFFVSTTRETHQQASNICQAMSMELASIYNDRENDELAQLLDLERTRYWTSGHKNSSADPWMWSRGENATYLHWGYGEPNNARGDEFCILVVKSNNDLRWLDQTCSDLARYICQRILPKVEVVVNGNRVMNGGGTNATMTIPGQERPLQVFIDVESGLPSDQHDRKSWDYFISDNKVTQAEAVISCRNRSEHLLTIDNKNKNELVFDMLKKKMIRGVYWTSATRSYNNSIWTWGNGQPVTYFHWGRNSRHTKLPACIEMQKTDIDITWSYLPCNETRQYICEKTHVFSINKAGGTSLNVLYDDELLYKNDSTVIVTHE